MRQLATTILAVIGTLATPGVVNLAEASGHGPVFSLAAPTNARKGWSLDLGLMGR